MFSESDYSRLHDLVFRPDYSGYKATVIEIPNGDGKADVEKRYAHVATKYLKTSEQHYALFPYLRKAHDLALKMAEAAGIPEKYMPRLEYGALRVLDYPPGAVSNRHEDFDLFTVMCYRDQPALFQSEEVYETVEAKEVIRRMRELNPQAHLGQLGQEIGLGPATPHWVCAGEKRQRSIVYFAIPDHDAVLPSGVTVRDWLNERMARSRTQFKAYE
jgi:hypothetical protein